ncbi:hypothetical protein EOD23_17510 [Mesorhizobium sp. USDA-HM6]|nr:hypothetical protein EOD23_17510 [Mesorhizobium sp. USDA-HM6]
MAAISASESLREKFVLKNCCTSRVLLADSPPFAFSSGRLSAGISDNQAGSTSSRRNSDS